MFVCPIKRVKLTLMFTSSAMRNKWILAGSPKQTSSHLTLLHLKYGCAAVCDVNLVAVNFMGAVKLMDCVIFVRIMNYSRSCQPDWSLITNNLWTKTCWHCSDVLQVSLLTPKLQFKLHYRWGIVGYSNQGHPQGSDITHIQHGYPKARGQLRLQGNWSERLWLWLP